MKKFNIGLIALLLTSSITSLSAYDINEKTMKYATKVFQKKFIEDRESECKKDTTKNFTNGIILVNSIVFRYSIRCERTYRYSN